MGAMYGKRQLNKLEIKGGFSLSNGMYCVWGDPSDEGLSVDVYRDKSQKELVSMQHGIHSGNGGGNSDMLQMLMESMINEF